MRVLRDRTGANHPVHDWTHENEIQFLATLGRHAPGRHRKRSVPRRVLLQGYLDALDQRTDMGSLDKERIRAYALQMLSEGN